MASRIHQQEPLSVPGGSFIVNQERLGQSFREVADRGIERGQTHFYGANLIAG